MKSRQLQTPSDFNPKGNFLSSTLACPGSPQTLKLPLLHCLLALTESKQLAPSYSLSGTELRFEPQQWIASPSPPINQGIRGKLPKQSFNICNSLQRNTGK